MDIPQIGIMLFGCTAVFLVGSTNHKTRRWAYIIGLIGQPFWFWASLKAGQWGIFVLSGWYTLSLGNGAWNHWRKK